MRVEVYKCRFTGKIFEKSDRKQYIKHLTALRIGLRQERFHVSIRDTFSDWLKAEKKKLTHVDMIAPWIMANQRFLMDAHNATLRFKSSDSGDTFHKSDEILAVMFTGLKFKPVASNSHSCPVRGVMNFSRAPGTVLGYPGFVGDVLGKTKRLSRHAYAYPMGPLLQMLKIHTGSGGGGNENWGWGVTLFVAEWPGLKTQIQEMEYDQVVSRLRGIL
jgi:hypothetical protein